MTARRRLGLLLFVAVLIGFAANEVRIFSASWLDMQGKGLLGYVLWRVGPWIGAISALAIYSFLIKDNPAYRFFEHVLLGTAMGFTSAPLVHDVILGKCFIPIYEGARALCASPGEAVTGKPTDLLLILAAVVGLLWYFQFSKRYAWYSRLGMAVALGCGAGMAFKDNFNNLVPQITQSFKNVFVLAQGGAGQGWLGGVAAGQTLAAAAFVIGTVSVLVYFFFSFEQRNVAVRGSARLGRFFLMVAFGAFFGNTFMSRLSALIERCDFLLREWLRCI
jgi:hypothetical protein